MTVQEAIIKCLNGVKITRVGWDNYIYYMKGFFLKGGSQYNWTEIDGYEIYRQELSRKQALDLLGFGQILESGDHLYRMNRNGLLEICIDNEWQLSESGLIGPIYATDERHNDAFYST